LLTKIYLLHVSVKTCRICKHSLKEGEESFRMFCGCMAHISHWELHKSKHGEQCPVHGPKSTGTPSSAPGEFKVPNTPGPKGQGRSLKKVFFLFLLHYRLMWVMQEGI
jgi:hypothetical protein